MALPKILGIETEFGVLHRGIPESNPVTASSLLINAYLSSLEDRGDAAPAVDWDFEDEHPDQDARGRHDPNARPPGIETHLVNAVLTNGARYYVDHAHPELSGPECADARSVVVWDRAAEVILQRSMAAARRFLPPDQEIVVHKNNSDGKGNAYGCHENYLTARSVPFERIAAAVTPHFVTRQLYTGAGKVGTEVPHADARSVPYQLTQRADFFEAEVGLETTLKRPIVNTRDEPHADPGRYRRLHVITGDANLSETATFLKVGTTGVVLAMLEDDALPPPRRFRDPVGAMRAVSHDLTLRRSHDLADGTAMRAVEVQRELLEAAEVWAERHGLDAVGGEAVGREVLRLWALVLDGLERDPQRLADRVDWIAKHRILEGYRQRHGLDWGDPRLAALALQYHDLRPERSLAARAGLVRLTTDAEVAAAVTEPPTDTRAYFRGRCLARFGDQVVTANWDSLVFDTGDDVLRRVPMLEPARGTRAHVGSVLDQSATPAELLDRLAGRTEESHHG